MHIGLYILTSVIIMTPTTTYTFPFGEEASRHYAVTGDRIPKGLHIRFRLVAPVAANKNRASSEIQRT